MQDCSILQQGAVPTASSLSVSPPPATDKQERVRIHAPASPRSLPVSRNQEKQRECILKAVKEGRMGLRNISLDKESRYLQQARKDPRPVYMILDGAPVSMLTSLGSETVGILDPAPLLIYKCCAATGALGAEDTAPYELPVKCLPALASLHEKMQEQCERERWPVYRPSTSGHLQADGTFSLPRFKPESPLQADRGMRYSEVVTESYDKHQIQCYCVSRNDPRTISSILAAKKQLEETLEIAELPLAIYSEQSGTMQVWFEKEIADLNQGKQLRKHELMLEEFLPLQGIQPLNFRNTLNLLSLPDHCKALTDGVTLNETDLSAATLSSELIELVARPECYSVEKLIQLCNRGGRANIKLWHNGSYQSLLDILFQTELDRCNHGKEPKHSRRYSEKALEMFNELVRRGASYSGTIRLVICLTDCPHFLDSFAALGAGNSSNIDVLYFGVPADSSGRAVILDRELQKLNFDDLQRHLKKVLYLPFKYRLKMPEQHQAVLSLLFYYGADPEPLLKDLNTELAAFKGQSSERYKALYGDMTPEEYCRRVRELYFTCKSTPGHSGWPEKLAKAKAEIDVLKQSLTGAVDTDTCTDDYKESGKLEFIAEAFRRPPSLNHADDNESTVYQILQHYYRRPGSERVLEALNMDTHPGVWKPSHSCSHVLRVRNNVHWYIELLESFNLVHFSPDEKALLSLAAIYHDAAAEDVPKRKEEQCSASFFLRDLSGDYPRELVQKVALALADKKNDIKRVNEEWLDERSRWYLRVLRFADRMDYIRCSTIGPDFPDWKIHQLLEQGAFCSELLDLPPGEKARFSRKTEEKTEEKTEFQRELEAAMHGAADLAGITGGSYNDLRAKGRYASRYGLAPDDNKLKYAFEQTPHPVAKMNDFVDDNVRRMIAARAGIKTCNDGNHRDCKVDRHKGSFRGIHNSWHDLKQVRVPACMSLKEKMQCEHDFSVLSQKTRSAIHREVSRLDSEGITMSLGTLTQQTLKSDAARSALAERGIRVVTHYRRRGFIASGKERLVEVLVPEIDPGNSAGNSAGRPYQPTGAEDF